MNKWETLIRGMEDIAFSPEHTHAQTKPTPPQPPTQQLQTIPPIASPADQADLSDLPESMEDFLTNTKTEKTIPQDHTAIIQKAIEQGEAYCPDAKTLGSLTQALRTIDSQAPLFQKFSNTFCQILDNKTANQETEPLIKETQANFYKRLCEIEELPLALRWRASICCLQTPSTFPDAEVFAHAVALNSQKPLLQKTPWVYTAQYQSRYKKIQKDLQTLSRSGIIGDKTKENAIEFCNGACEGLEQTHPQLANHFHLCALQLTARNNPLTLKQARTIQEICNEQPDAIQRANQSGFITHQFAKQCQHSQTFLGRCQLALSEISWQKIAQNMATGIVNRIEGMAQA